jgi:hypothetical protein
MTPAFGFFFTRPLLFDEEVLSGKLKPVLEGLKGLNVPVGRAGEVVSSGKSKSLLEVLKGSNVLVAPAGGVDSGATERFSVSEGSRAGELNRYSLTLSCARETLNILCTCSLGC